MFYIVQFSDYSQPPTHTQHSNKRPLTSVIFAPLNLLSEELFDPLGEVFLDAPDDADANHDEGDGDETQPERFLDHPLTEGLVGDVQNPGLAVTT